MTKIRGLTKKEIQYNRNTFRESLFDSTEEEE